jgi:hypothetical protein
MRMTPVATMLARMPEFADKKDKRTTMSVSNVLWMLILIAVVCGLAFASIAAFRRFAPARYEHPEDESVQRMQAALREASHQAAQAAAAAELAGRAHPSLATLSIGSSLEAIAAVLADAAAVQDPAALLMKCLAERKLDEGLANLSLVCAFFAAAEDWHAALAKLTKLEGDICSIFRMIDVELDLPYPLSLVVDDRIRTITQDLRRIGAIAVLHRQVVERAGWLAPGDVLIVDRPMAGWTSKVFGTRTPAVVVFNPASWTSPS